MFRDRIGVFIGRPGIVTGGDGVQGVREFADIILDIADVIAQIVIIAGKLIKDFTYIAIERANRITDPFEQAVCP